jgi:hypothetical protein
MQRPRAIEQVIGELIPTNDRAHQIRTFEGEDKVIGQELDVVRLFIPLEERRVERVRRAFGDDEGFWGFAGAEGFENSCVGEMRVTDRPYVMRTSRIRVMASVWG